MTSLGQEDAGAMAGWNRRLVLSLSITATIHVVSAQPGMAFPIQTNAAAARRYLNENTLYDDGTRIVVRSLHNCWSKRSSSGRLKAFVCDQGSADKTLRSGVSMRCDIVKAKITRKRAKLTTTNCR